MQNDNHPEISHDYINLAFVRLPKFKKTIEECESLQDKLIFSLCHAHAEGLAEGLAKGILKSMGFSIAQIVKATGLSKKEILALK